MSNPPAPGKGRGSSVGPGSVGSGVSVGAALVWIATHLRADHPLREPLLYFAPAIAAGVSSVWVKWRIWYDRQVEETARQEEEDRRAREARQKAEAEIQALKDMQWTLEGELLDPNLPEELRQEYEQRLRELKTLRVQEIIDRATAIINARQGQR